MTRIPFWTWEARLAALGGVVALIFTGCLSQGSRGGAPELDIYPFSAAQGDHLAINMSVEGVGFDDCDAFTPDSLVFSGPEGEAQIEVLSLDIVSKDNLRGYIQVQSEVTPQMYNPTLRCNALTVFSGDFQVLEKQSELELTITPDNGAAGARRIISFQVDRPFFDEATSYVMFGDGTSITVAHKQFISAYEFDVHIEISSFAPKKTIAVTAVTGNLVARSDFTITERSDSVIWVDKDSVDRPSAADTDGEQHALRIFGQDVDFVWPDPDAGIDEDSASQVNFHDKPGIRVLSSRVRQNTQGEREIEATILVENTAKIGPTPLYVQTGDHEVSANFAIRLAPNDQYLNVVSPSHLLRGVRETLVFVEAINFDFANVQSVTCLASDCNVVGWVASPARNKMVLNVSVDASFEADIAMLEVVTSDPQHTLVTYLEVVDPEGLVVVSSLDALTQGDEAKFIRLKLNNGEFAPDATVTVPPRLGVSIAEQRVDPADSTVLRLSDIDVAEDAPVGPALFQISSGADVLGVPIQIKPFGTVPSISVFPSATLERFGKTTLNLEAEGLELVAEKSRFRFDDPGITVSEVAVDEDRSRAVLEVSVSPAVEAGLVIFYVEGDGAHAAATFRVLEATAARLVDQSAVRIVRGTEVTTPRLSIRATGISFDSPVAAIMDNIELEVFQPWLDINDQQRLYFDLKVQEAGPGGWTGIVISSNAQSIVVPVYIDAGGDESLTLQSEIFQTVQPGVRPMAVTTTMPVQAKLLKSLLDVRTGLEGTFVENPSKTPQGQDVAFSLYVSFDLSSAGNDVFIDGDIGQGIPIFVLAEKGAAVGFLEVELLETFEVRENDPWRDRLQAGETGVATVVPGQVPSLLYSSYGWPDYADLNMEVLSYNGLDTAEASTDGVLWLIDQTDSRVAFSPSGPPEDRLSELGIAPMGRRAMAENTPDNEDTVAWAVARDPCETPFLGFGEIAGALDRDSIVLSATNCRLTAAVMARGLADRPWDTPDLFMELRNDNGQLIGNYRSVGWPSSLDADPRLFLEEGLEDVSLLLGAELGSTGGYLVNIRPTGLVREIGREVNQSYIEIELEPGTLLDGLSIQLLDADAADPFVTSFSLSSVAIENDGLIVIAGSTTPEADAVDPVAVFPDDGPFAVRLLNNGEVIDAVQLGQGADDYGEGEPIPDDWEYPVIYRAGGMDTNDNLSDFVGSWVETPGY